MRAWLALLMAATVLSGCAAKPTASGPMAEHDHAAMLAQMHGLWNYTTPDPGGLAYVRDYAGALTPQEATNTLNGPPLGVSPPTFSTCCYFDWVDTPDLMAVDQLVALRVTLTWTNTQTDHSGFDVAACLPWRCTTFNQGDDESLANGEHKDVLTLITGGNQQFLDDFSYSLGVRYTNAVLATGLPYTLHVEVSPVGNALALQEPYVIKVPANATVVAQLVGPYTTEGIEAGLMVFGGDDRPLRWIGLAGNDGARFNITMPAGTYVVSPFDLAGGFVRLSVDRDPGATKLERLAVEVGQVELAAVADAQAHAGDVSYQPPPASMGDFPFFLYGDGPYAQSLFGFEPQPVGGGNITFTSSSGLIAAVDQQALGAQAPAFGQTCLNCNGNGLWHPMNYIDDDGTYSIHWSSSGAAGAFVMFTQRYVR